jgi:hypothetical protein
MYSEVYGTVVNEQDEKDDIKISTYTFPYRSNLLNRLESSLKILKEFSFRIILASDHESNSIEYITRRLEVIKASMDIYKLKVTCETKNCNNLNNKIPIYANRCQLCSSDRVPKTKLDESIDTLINLKNRVCFLIGMLSSSLSNELTRYELDDVILEANLFTSIIK